MRRFRPVLISALLLAAALLWQEPLRRSALAVLRFPFTLLTASLRVLMTLPRLPSLGEENERLRAELTQRQLEGAQLSEALRHTLQEQALLTAWPSFHGTTAVVLARSLIPTQQTVLLDRGSRHGLVLESVVLDADGVIGRVVELHGATCVVMLLTDPESRIAGLVERSRETGLVVGQGRGLCELRYLDDAADVVEGDRVLTAGLGGPFPKGLPLGTVTRVTRSELSGSARVWVRPAARPGRVEEVLCLPPSQ